MTALKDAPHLRSPYGGDGSAEDDERTTCHTEIRNDQPSEDLGMLFIPELGLLVKIHRDEKGLYVHLPRFGTRRFYLKEMVKHE